MTKLRIVCAAAALAATASGTALADASANVGLMSDYIFRGAYQAESVAFGGLDIEADNGFYIGTWAADVKDGLEYDIYLGYAGGGDNFSWYVGGTGYYYTDNYDNTYEELNLGLSFGFLSIDYALGDYSYDPTDVVDPVGRPALFWDEKQTYQYVGVTFAPERGPYYFLGRTDYANIGVETSANLCMNCGGTGRIHGTGKDGYWVEIGKSIELMEDLELNVAGLFSGDVRTESPPTSPSTIALSQDPTSEFALTVTLTKTLRFNN